MISPLDKETIVSYTGTPMISLEVATKKLRGFYAKQRRLPSYQEMCQLFGFASKKASFLLVQKLIEAGIVEKDSKGKLIPRQLFPSLPVLGTIKAGYPSDAQQQIIDTLSIHQYLVDHPEQSYVLRVSGDSMMDAGIYPDDLVIIEKGREPKEGDVVVAAIDEEWTLKYFQKQDGRICLMPANPKYPPLYPENSLSVWGIVVSVIRKFH